MCACVIDRVCCADFDSQPDTGRRLLLPTWVFNPSSHLVWARRDGCNCCISIVLLQVSKDVVHRYGCGRIRQVFSYQSRFKVAGGLRHSMAAAGGWIDCLCCRVFVSSYRPPLGPMREPEGSGHQNQRAHREAPCWCRHCTLCLLTCSHRATGPAKKRAVDDQNLWKHRIGSRFRRRCGLCQKVSRRLRCRCRCRCRPTDRSGVAWWLKQESSKSRKKREGVAIRSGSQDETRAKLE